MVPNGFNFGNYLWAMQKNIQHIATEMQQNVTEIKVNLLPHVSHHQRAYGEEEDVREEGRHERREHLALAQRPRNGVDAPVAEGDYYAQAHARGYAAVPARLQGERNAHEHHYEVHERKCQLAPEVYLVLGGVIALVLEVVHVLPEVAEAHVLLEVLEVHELLGL